MICCPVCYGLPERIVGAVSKACRCGCFSVRESDPVTWTFWIQRAPAFDRPVGVNFQDDRLEVLVPAPCGDPAAGPPVPSNTSFLVRPVHARDADALVDLLVEEAVASRVLDS